jgi:hypothetical protein
MGLGDRHVMTHDSIGLGEDGPTHQPVEHLAALRAIPNMRVFRPCDAIEVAECWQLALNRIDGPSTLALTRQNLPQLRTDAGQPLRRRRLRTVRRGRRQGRRDDLRHRLGGRDRGGGAQAARRQGQARPRRLGALPRPVPVATGGCARQGDWRRAGQGSPSKPQSVRAGTRSSARPAFSSA